MDKMVQQLNEAKKTTDNSTNYPIFNNDYFSEKKFVQTQMNQPLIIPQQDSTESYTSEQTTQQNNFSTQNQNTNCQRSNQIDIPNNFNSSSIKQKTTKPKITAFSLGKKIIQNLPIFIYEHTAFVYNNGAYLPISDEQLRQIIISLCRDEIGNKGSYDIVNGAMKFVLSEPSIQHTGELKNQQYLTFKNGTLNLYDGQLYQHTPSVKTFYSINCSYLAHQQNLNTPHFDSLLEHISGGDNAIKKIIWQMFGYCLAPDTKAKKGFLLQGVKHSGKSLLCQFLASFFSNHAVSALSAQDFAEKFALSELANKALCISVDMSAEPLNARSVSNIKKLSGNDLISAATKYKKNTEFYFGGKLILVSNHQLLTKKHDDAFADRIVAIPFPYSVPTAEQDGDLYDKLLQEKDAIATKAIQYYFRLRQNHYIFAGDYELNSGDFLNNECENNNETKIDCFIKKCFEADRNSELFISDIYALFLELFDSDIKLNSFSQIFFNKAKALFNCNKSRKRKNTNSNPTSLITGIALKEEYIKLLGE